MMAERSGIFKMFREIMERRAAKKEHHRLIEREKTMLDAGKIVLISEFNNCMWRGPVNGSKTFLESEAQKHIGLFWQVLAEVYSKEPKFFMPLRVEELTKESRQAIEGKTMEVVDICRAPHGVYNSSPVRVFLQMGAMPYQSALIYSGTAFPLCSYLEATYQGVAALCWEETVKGSFFTKAERGSLVRGEGRNMIDFWKAVNNLSDYSHLFPEIKNLGGPGKRKQEKKLSPVPRFFPVFDGA